MTDDPNFLASNLQWLMDRRGLSGNSLAEALNNRPPQPTIHRILTGESQTPRDPTLRPIADYFGVSINDLRYIDLRKIQSESNIRPAAIGTRRIPLLNSLQVVKMTEAASTLPRNGVFEFLLTDLELSDNAFALEIDDDSMTPEFNAGDRVIIDPALSPRPGDYVVAAKEGEDATFKRYRARGTNEMGQDVFELVPLNPDYPTVSSEHRSVKIIGVMVEHRRYRRR
ncbi:helix-turn-helix domain-containing protein [Burkholderia sp. 22088]|uniref:helix-turn-helix domain-containing protein n=1 Tax=Burkholderia sp. 22088 TaxID=3453871 RepID=UPI003F85BB3D